LAKQRSGGIYTDEFLRINRNLRENASVSDQSHDCASWAPALSLIKGVQRTLSLKRKEAEALVRTVFHFLSLVALVAAIMAGTLDAIESVSSSAVVMTSLGNHWQNLDVVSLTLAEEAFASYISADAWRWAVAPVLAQPAFGVFLVIALLFWMIGYRRPRFAGRFSA
jgi:hypothetical protein